MSKPTDSVSRRAFLQRLSLAAGAGALLGSWRDEPHRQGSDAAAHATDDTCTDVSNLSEEQVQTRESLKYVDESPHADKRCDNCRLFEPPEGEEACGACQIVPGSIHPKAYCAAWVPAE